MSRRGHLWALLAGMALVVGLAAPGCGGGDDGGGEQSAQQPAQPRQTYDEVLQGLKQAALSKGTYMAIRRARSLEPSEAAAVKSFCETAWQLDVNSETEKLAGYAYMVSRIRSRTEFVLAGASSAGIGPAVTKLLATVDLRSLDGDLVRRYKKACYQ